MFINFGFIANVPLKKNVFSWTLELHLCRLLNLDDKTWLFIISLIQSEKYKVPTVV